MWFIQIHGQAWGRKKKAKKREKVFPPYQVNSTYLNWQNQTLSSCTACQPIAGKKLLMKLPMDHNPCLFTQAHNRLHAQKAILSPFIRQGLIK